MYVLTLNSTTGYIQHKLSFRLGAGKVIFKDGAFLHTYLQKSPLNF